MKWCIPLSFAVILCVLLFAPVFHGFSMTHLRDLQCNTTHENCGATSTSLRRIENWIRSEELADDSIELIIGFDSSCKGIPQELKMVTENLGIRILNEVSIAGRLEAITVVLQSGKLNVLFESLFYTKSVAGNVKYVEPNYKIACDLVPDDPYWNQQWGSKKIEVDYAWNTTIGNSSILVAIMDTGIEYDHPDLVDNYVALGYDWVNDDNDPMDDKGHGTHCAGIIAATINNGIGVAGVADVRIMAEKILDASGEGNVDDFANAIIHAVDSGANILSNSWGHIDLDSTLLHNAIKYAVDKNVLVVASAGNDQWSYKHYPAAYDEVIAVTATTENDNYASFTNFANWVEIAAPGNNILSTWLDDSYESKSGTSMSCPYIAGVAALAWSEFPDLSADLLREWLRYSVDDLGEEGFDPYFGYGRVNARKALEPPSHDLVIVDWEKPIYAEPASPNWILVKTEIANFGSKSEDNIVVKLWLNDENVDDNVVSHLDPFETAIVWHAFYAPEQEGVYRITSEIVSVDGETNTKNNVISGCMGLGTRTFYVPNNYTRIQDAICEVDENFTIIVDSGVYNESLLVEKPITLIGKDKDTTEIHGVLNSPTIHVMSNNTKISGFNITGWFDAGICLENSHNSSISDSIITDSNNGIKLLRCVSCNMSENHIKNTLTWGIVLSQSSDCQIRKNTIEQSTQTSGIYLYEAPRCSVTENNLTSNNECGIKVTSSEFCNILQNNITSNQDGIRIDDSGNSEIRDNDITSNQIGIEISNPGNSEIRDNDITSNQIGVYLLSGCTPTLKIYHNNFIQNTKHVQLASQLIICLWNDGYEFGGNYWDDYTGPDQYYGPDQDKPHRDVIIDEGLWLNYINYDEYPLARQWGILYCDITGDGYVGIDDITEVAEHNGLTPENQDWNPIYDVNKDRIVDITDINIVAEHFGEEY